MSLAYYIPRPTLDAKTETAEEEMFSALKDLQSPFAMGKAGEEYKHAETIPKQQSLVFDRGTQGLLEDQREGLWRAASRRWPLPDYETGKGRETFQ